MVDDLLYLIFCYNGKDPVEHGALIKRENANGYFGIEPGAGACGGVEAEFSF